MKLLALTTALILAAAPAFAAEAPSSNMDQPPSPLDLKGAIGYALDHNYAILQAREIIRQQEGVIVQVQSQAIPNVNAAGQYERNATEISQTYPQSSSLYNISLKATQTLYAGGGVRSAIQSAKFSRDAAAYDLQTAIDAALLDVRTKFYNVVLTRDQIKVQEENIKLYEHQLTDSKNQFEAGTVSNFEVLRAKVSLANAQPGLITARNSYRIAVEQLRQAIGTRTAAQFPDVVGSLDFAVQTFDGAASIEAAHNNRPELRKYEKLEASSEESVTTARSTLYPNLQAFAGYEWGAFGYTDPAYNSPSEKGWTLGLQSNWAIFDGRATAGKVRQAKSLLEQARLSKASEYLEVDVEVRQALSSLDEANELVNASRQVIDQATEALRLADAKFHAGSATQLDVLTSQVSLTQSKTDSLTANYNYLVALANVRKAVGLSDALVTP
jgi:outer membrane protein